MKHKLLIISNLTFAISFILVIYGCSTAPGGTVASTYDKHGPYGVIRLLNQGMGTISTGTQGYAPLGNNNDPSAFTLYYPKGGQAGERFPLLTWGNGSLTTPTFYDELIGHMVSYGFIVIGTNTGAAGSGVEMLEAVEWALGQNSQPESPIYGMVDIEHIGAFGHSQGGSGTCMTGADPRIDAIASLSGVPLLDLTATASVDIASVEKIQCPAFFITSAGEYSSTGMMGNMGKGSETAFNAANVPGVFAVTAAGDHGEYQDIADNVHFPYVTSNDALQTRGAVAAWFDWQLKGTSELKSHFVGTNCEFCISPNFSLFRSKGF